MSTDSDGKWVKKGVFNILVEPSEKYQKEQELRDMSYTISKDGPTKSEIDFAEYILYIEDKLGGMY